MMHDKRLYSVAPVATAEALVERLTEASGACAPASSWATSFS